MNKMEDRSRLQEQEIAQLTTNAVKDRKVINQLNERVAELEGASTFSSSLARSKRLYRLLPITHEGNGETTNNNEPINLQFYGPATNCDELSKLGYTLNGYYLVKSKDQELESNGANINVVYCLFQQPLKGSIKKGDNKISSTASTTVQSTASPTNELKLESKLSTIKSTVTPSSDSASPTFDSSKLVPVYGKEGTSFLLKNKRNKCMASAKLSPHGGGFNFPYETNCDPKDKYQYWKWCGSKSLCNYFDKFLSKEFLGIGADGKIFAIKFMEFDSSGNIDQKWRATDVGQLLDSSGLCLGAEYRTYDQAKLLFGVDSCNKNDAGQFWSFESVLTPATISTPRPKLFTEFQFSIKTSNSLKGSSTKMIPLNQKDGKSYHVINQRNKCISSRNVSESEVEAVQSNCNVKEIRQLWKWSGDSLCSTFGCLSKFKKSVTYFRVLLKPEKFHSLWVNQNWSATEHQGQLLSSSGSCLGVEEYLHYPKILC